ncbi:MAG: hypothetical protein ACREP7_08350, partial [Lysobacter sp.]
MSGSISTHFSSRPARPAALAAATVLALSLMSSFTVAAGEANLSGVLPGTTFERFIVKYRKGSAEQLDAGLRQR